MQINFYAKGDLLFPVPGTILIVGAPHKYVGRYHDVESRSYPAKGSHESFDDSTTEGRRILKVMRRESPLYPADKETADRCGVPFVELTYDCGEWKPKK